MYKFLKSMSHKKLVLLRQIYQRNQVPNYASENGLGTK